MCVESVKKNISMLYISEIIVEDKCDFPELFYCSGDFVEFSIMFNQTFNVVFDASLKIA